MAIIKGKNWALGEIQGSIGNVVVSIDDAGRQIVRSKPTSVSNPKTIGQVNARAKFAEINRIAGIAPLSINRGFKDAAGLNGLHSPRNRFMSENIRNGFTGATAESLNVTSLRFGQGELNDPSVIVDDFTMTGAGATVDITITDDNDVKNLVSDKLFLGFLNLDDGQWKFAQFSQRNGGQVTFNKGFGATNGNWVMLGGYIRNSESGRHNTNGAVTAEEVFNAALVNGLYTDVQSAITVLAHFELV